MKHRGWNEWQPNETFCVMHAVHTRDRVPDGPFRYEQKDLAQAFRLHGCFGVMLPLLPLIAHLVLPRLRPRIVNVSSTMFPIGVIPKATVAFFVKFSIEAGLFDMPSSESPVPAPEAGST
jgi:hypothetical protein